MDEIIAILRNDPTLKGLTEEHIKPFGQLEVGKGLTYEFSPGSSNGIKATERLTVTSVAYSIDDSMAILNRVKKLLITIGDDKLTDKILKVTQNGGGSMNNIMDGKNMYHFTAIFYITRREK